jgi:hypothetical protein
MQIINLYISGNQHATRGHSKGKKNKTRSTTSWVSVRYQPSTAWYRKGDNYIHSSRKMPTKNSILSQSLNKLKLEEVPLISSTVTKEG